MRARLLAVAWLAGSTGWLAAAPQEPPDLTALLTRVAGRINEYYQRARTLVCIEKATVQPIDAHNWSFAGFARTVESELRVEWDTAADGDLPEAEVVRTVRRVNGRAPRERDARDRAGCTDPNPLSVEPLQFLLPGHRGEYRFTSVRAGKQGGRAALAIDFVSADRTSRPILIEDERGHDDCFDWKGPLATKGRVWVDASTYDVLRVERWLLGPVDVRVPWKLQRRYNLPAWIVLDRDDLTMTYAPVTFSEPNEVVVLPDSVSSLTVVRAALQSTRRTEVLGGYRRFLTGVVVKPARSSRD